MDLDRCEAATVLVADDDIFVLRRIEEYLRNWGYRALLAPTKAEVFAQLKREKPSMILLDLQFGETDGMELLVQLKTRDPETPIAVLTGSGSIDAAVRAIKLGASDFLTKPADKDRLQSLLAFAVKKNKLDRESPKSIPARAESHPLGRSPAFNRSMELLRSVAPTDATVLITGESGTGKELAAKAVHDWSPRRAGPFVPLNMATLPRELAESLLFGHEKGAFTGADKAQAGACELANGGTLFLDEIGEMEIGHQAKLLRFLQERTIQRVGSSRTLALDVRIVAATNRDLPERVRQGHFREDLFFRLNVVPVALPPLRERREDIPVLAEAFLARAAEKYHKGPLSLEPELARAMAEYPWPGNIRQLENTLERMAILATDSVIRTGDYRTEFTVGSPGVNTPPPLFSPPNRELNSPLAETVSEMRFVDRIEKEAIENALVTSRGNVGQAAHLLGLSQATVYRKLKRYQIRPS